MLTLLVMIMPAAALVLPIFLELNAMHLLGGALSVILPFSFFPFGVYIAYIYYATSVPGELLDAARVDGCGEWKTFFHIALPLAKPIVALVFFFSFVADWNNFFLPFAVLGDSSKYPIQVGLSNLLSSTPLLQPRGGWWWRVGEHLPARAGSGDPACGRPRRHRLPPVSARAGTRPGRWWGQGVTVERRGLVVDVIREKREEYLRLHSAVWPQVEQTLRDCNVSNYTIFVLEDTLFAYYEYVGTDHAPGTWRGSRRIR